MIGHETIKGYLLGFTLSVIFTLAAYFSVTQDWLSGWILLLTIALLALLQAAAQLYFFLPLTKGGKWSVNFITFLLMLLFASILVIGSLWIMYNLNGRVMPSHEEMMEWMQQRA